jgi:hypothetical protein
MAMGMADRENYVREVNNGQDDTTCSAAGHNLCRVVRQVGEQSE